MERFIPMFDDRDRLEYERLRNDPEWGKIYAFIRRDYWHVTSTEAWREIRASGAIKPNVDGRYDKRFGDITNRSFGYLHRYVSLFDFLTPSEEEVMRQWGNSWDVLVDQKHDGLLLQLGRNNLAAKIVQNSTAWSEGKAQVRGGCIPHVEVWYPKEIAVDSVRNVWIIPATDRFEFEPRLINDYKG